MGIINGITNGRCRYNMRINCIEHNNCDKCGWNPTVSAKRVREWKRKHISNNKIKVVQNRDMI